jgi:DNA-binding transcriptional regulator YiaG
MAPGNAVVSMSRKIVHGRAFMKRDYRIAAQHLMHRRASNAVDTTVHPRAQCTAVKKPSMTAAELVAAREALGLSRDQLGATFNVTLRAIQAWELGTRRVPPGVAVAVRLLLQQQLPAKAGAPRKRTAR